MTEENEVFTPEQTAAIKSPEQFIAVIAGPGTGKTFTLAHRIAAQIRAGEDPETLVAASFTNDACKALRDELVRLIGETATRVNIFTFHSFSRFLVEKELAKTTPEATISIADEWDTKTLLKGLKPYITARKINSLPLQDLQTISSFNEYMDRLETHKLTDFRHLLIRAQKLAKTVAKDYNHIFLDEFQDTSPEQFELLEQLIQANPQLAVTVVGDPNQAIYSSMSHHASKNVYSPFGSYEKLVSPTVYNLSVNFRAPESLVNFTNVQMPIPNHQSSARPGTNDIPKLLSLELNPFGSPTGAHAIDMALVNEIKSARNQFPSVAVLTYTNKAVAHVTELLKKERIPFYSGFNKAMFDEPNSRIVYLLFRYIKQENQVQMLSLIDQADILTKPSRMQLQRLTEDFTLPILDQLPNLQRAKNKDTLVKFKRSVEVSTMDLKVSSEIEDIVDAVKRVLRSIPGAKFDSHVQRLFEVIETYSQQFDSHLPLVPQFMQHFQDTVLEQDGAVNIRTIHSSKGLEWSAVIMPYLGVGDSKRFYQPWGNSSDYQKTLYVGMTRARDSLTMLSSGQCWPLEGNQHFETHYPEGKERPVNGDARIRFPKLFSPLQLKPGMFAPMVAKRGFHIGTMALGLLKLRV